MDNQIIITVRELKAQGLSDQEITENLRNDYPEAQIADTLNALKYMKPNNTDVNHGASIKTKPNKTRRRLVSFFVILAVLITLPITMRLFTIINVNNLNNKLLDEFDVKESYIIGSSYDCLKQSPARIGDATSTLHCYRTTAVVFYPKIELGEYNSTQELQGSNYRVKYVDQEGGSIEEFIQTGTPVKQTGQGAGFRDAQVSRHFGLGPFDRLKFSKVVAKYEKNQPGLLENGWEWNTPYPAINGLQEDIDRTIRNNEEPAKGAPTVQEALDNQIAPLVVYYTDRYCHSPDLILLDNFCLMPN